MKRLFLCLLCGVMFLSTGFPAFGAESQCSVSKPAGAGKVGISNPAAVYCTELGYTYEVAEGQGVCIFGDGKQCDGWEFLEGKCGQEYSYCAKNGYNVITRTDGQNVFSREYAVCVKKQKGGAVIASEEAVGSVTDLMGLSALVGTGTLNDNNTAVSAEQTEDATEAEGAVSIEALPLSYDWRSVNGSNWMTSVKDQGGCGSCWAFAAVGTAESNYSIEQNSPGTKLDLSEQYLVADCCASCGDCSGGWSNSAFAFMRTDGIPDEGCFSYRAANASCSGRCSDWSSRLFKVYNQTSPALGTRDREKMKQYLVNNGPCVVYLGVLDTYGGHWEGDIYRCTNDSNINHAVVLVGYNDTGNVATSYWLIKNSWGTGWGYGGYMKIGWDDSAQYGECHIEHYFYDVTVLQPIAITAPASGENAGIGYTKTITWTPGGYTGNVKIDLWRPAGCGGAWEAILGAESIANSGSFTWNVTGPAAAGCQIRITRINNPLPNAYVSSLFDIKTNNPPTTPVLSSITPNPAGAGQDVTLIATSTDPDAGDRITYAWEIIKPSNGGTIYATTSSSVVQTVNVVGTWTLYCTAVDTCGARSAKAGPWTLQVANITVSSPASGETVFIGGSKTIEWTSTGLAGNVKIDRKNGCDWLPIAASVSNTGTYSWLVTEPANNSCIIRVSSEQNPNIAGFSGSFVVRNPNQAPGTPSIAITPNPVQAAQVCATGSTDPEGDAITYHWEIIDPNNQTMTRTETNSCFNFTATMAGNWTFYCTAIDAFGAQSEKAGPQIDTLCPAGQNVLSQAFPTTTETNTYIDQGCDSLVAGQFLMIKTGSQKELLKVTAVNGNGWYTVQRGYYRVEPHTNPLNYNYLCDALSEGGYGKLYTYPEYYCEINPAGQLHMRNAWIERNGPFNRIAGDTMEIRWKADMIDAPAPGPPPAPWMYNVLFSHSNGNENKGWVLLASNHRLYTKDGHLDSGNGSVSFQEIASLSDNTWYVLKVVFKQWREQGMYHGVEHYWHALIDVYLDGVKVATDIESTGWVWDAPIAVWHNGPARQMWIDYISYTTHTTTYTYYGDGAKYAWPAGATVYVFGTDEAAAVAAYNGSTTTTTSTINPVAILEDTCSSLSGWTQSGGVTQQFGNYDGRTCFYQDGYGEYNPSIYRNDVVIPDEFVATVVARVAAGQAPPNSAGSIMTISKPGFSLSVAWGLAAGAISVYDGSTWNLVPEATIQGSVWTDWEFRVHAGNPSAATVDVYKDGVLKQSGVRCASTGGTDNSIEFESFGGLNHGTWYIDNIKIM